MIAQPADALQAHLETMFGAGATFREGQREAIEAVVRDGSHTLVVQRTGWGKSLVYWIATRVRRDGGHGPTLIVSPLLSLMRNQIEAADRLGLRAVTINSANRDDWGEIERALAADEIDVLFVSAQRFANEDFNARLLPGIRRTIGMFVVDEAHCISDWGHEFVPDYRRIGRLLPSLGPAVPVLGTTATANDRVVEDVARQLGDDVTVIRGPLARDTLHLDAIPLRDQAERLAWLAEHLPGMPGAGIVYCLTVADTQRVAGWLRGQGIDAHPYNADMDPAEREALEQDLLANRLKALVATVALGMGFDKPDLGFVVHYQRPGSPIAYYQQVGRAGRAVENAYGILLSGREDDAIAEYFLSTAFPPAARMREILEALEAVDTATIRTLQAEVNLPYGQIEKALKLLEVDGAVGKDRGRFYRTAEPWEQDEAWVAGVLEARRRELATMREYVETRECRMAFLGRLLNDPAAAECGHCANDGGVAWPRSVSPDLVQEAVTFLRRDVRGIEPRRQWPEGARIAKPTEIGRALCILGDPGWGRDVARSMADGTPFDEHLAGAAVEVIRGRWRPNPQPEWVTCVPSVTRPGAVEAYAQRVAMLLGLPFAPSLASTAGPAQASMQNSAQQAANARSRLSALPRGVRSGPVLLVDDLVDSRWTLTVASALLRDAGAGPVLPFALAVATPRGE
ncbi:MAG TPA: RecQ family ATP-dependent DNA helicase [Candidatus Limnocylindrales bacterium]|nr:RecQ family ATP-dependent DNA helicase [Candidatus Limnocylindrales bacterium]